MPLEFQQGTASVEQAKAWVKGLLMGNGAITLDERELIPARRHALFFCDVSNAGTGGNFYMVFERTATGLKYLGDMAFAKYRAVSADCLGRPRSVTYWHMGASEGRLTLWLPTPTGFNAVKCVTIHPGDGGTDEGNRVYDAFFGSSPVDDSGINNTFGITQP